MSRNDFSYCSEEDLADWQSIRVKDFGVVRWELTRYEDQAVEGMTKIGKNEFAKLSISSDLPGEFLITHNRKPAWIAKDLL